jgi:hypothetical protein
LLRHFLPSGIEGLLKIFIPVLELIGVLIRPMTLAIRLATNIRCSISMRLREINSIKDEKTLNIVGLNSWGEFKKHIENQFTEGMNWDNYGNKIETDWSIDHIIPISTATTLDEIKKLNHYTNLRPMWHIDNIKKRDKLI